MAHFAKISETNVVVVEKAVIILNLVMEKEKTEQLIVEEVQEVEETIPNPQDMEALVVRV